MNITWLAKTYKSVWYTGTLEDGSWRDCQKNKGGGIITSLQLLCDDKTFAHIEDGKDGYFLGNKVIANLQNGAQIDLVGIGYYSKSDDLSRIKWYRKDTLEFVTVEVRDGDKCGFCLIKN